MEQLALDKQIVIDGKFVRHYESITINQYIHKHHTFEIVLDLQTIEKAGSHTLDKSKNWLGKQLTTNVSGKAFIGIILDISLNHEKGHHGQITLKGASQTILLESGKQQQSWLDKDLTTIVKDILQGSPIRTNIKPLYTDPIPYQSQYLESNFQYLQRLAQQYNEWFYFNGVDLIFGKPISNEDTPLLEYGREITNINIQIQTYQPNFSTYSYEPYTDKVFEGDKQADNKGLNELGNHALKASKQLYPNSTSAPSDVLLQDKSSLDHYLKTKAQELTAEGNILTAQSTQRNLRVGSVIKISSAKWEDSQFEIKKYGEYIITELNHYAGIGGSYYNTFKALPAGIQTLPQNTAIQQPIAHQQIAKVVNNNDPYKKGRVQVAMQWQKNGMKTNWIRVLTPDAGNSELIKQNRGFVFIPEVGDQVMISFEYNDPNRPFVLGSLFTGKTGIGGGDKNVQKSIITRSGHTILLDDTAGKESIVITDKSGNELLLDTKKGTMRIYAPEELLLESKKIKLKAAETINLEAKQKIRTQANENIELEAIKENVTVKAGEKIIQHTKEINLNADDNLKAVAEKTVIGAKSEIIIKGKQKAVVSSALTELIGASNEIKLP